MSKAIRGTAAAEHARDNVIQAFIAETDAVQLWSVQMPNGGIMRGYHVGGKVFIIQSFGAGFEVYIPACTENNTQATFDAVRRYIQS